jgi:2-hydroxy-6-oxo-6-(2'-aminophenyl)hexa-2,4-dienoate hydrolase
MSDDFEHRFLDAGGIRTHYLEAGDSTAAPVILLHGGGAGADAFGNWRATLPHLAAHFHVFAVDMVGFGDSDKPAPPAFSYSQARRNEHLTDFIEALDIGPVHLVGNSMGGATSIGVAAARPELVAKLVLMGSAGLNAELTPALLPIVQYDFTAAGMRALIRALTADGFAVAEELVEYRLQRSLEPATRAAYAAIMGWVREQGGLYYDEHIIRAVRAPTLVVNGKDDLVVPVANAYRFLELIPNSWGYIIPHCGHWAMLEAPQDFVGATIRFLLSH